MKQKGNNKISPQTLKIKSTPWISVKLFVPLILIWIIFVVYKYYSSDQFAIRLSALEPLINGLFELQIFNQFNARIFLSVILGSWLCWSSIGVGLLYLKYLLPSYKEDYYERISFGLGLGLGTFSILTFLMGFMSLYYRITAFGVLIILSFIAFSGWKSITKTKQTNRSGSIPKIYKYLIGFLLLINLVGVFSPEIFYDALYYHIGVQNYYILNHRILRMPSIFFSAFPMSMEMLYNFGILLWDEFLAKLIHFITCCGLTITVLNLCKRYLSLKIGIWTCILFLSMPMVPLNTWTTAVETGQTFFQLLGFYALLNALQIEENKIRTRWFIISGIITGLAMGTKYSGFTLLPVSLVIIVWYRIINQKKSYRYVLSEILLFCTITTTMVLPWLIKNIAYNKNPIYPFMGTVWGEPKIPKKNWVSFLSDTSARNMKTVINNPEERKNFLLHPWVMTMKGQSNADFIGPAFLAFLPLIVFISIYYWPLRLLKMFFILQWLIWLVTTAMLRYFIPNIVFMAILISCAVEWLDVKPYLKKIINFVIVVIAFANVFWVLIIYHSFGGWLVPTGKMSKEAYLSQIWSSYPYPSYAAYEYMNWSLPQNSKVLILGDARSYYLKRKYIVSSVQDEQYLVIWAKESKNEEELYNKFKEKKVTHIFLNYMEAKRTSGYGIFPWDEHSWSIFDKFWNKHIELTWDKVNLTDKRNPQVLFVYEIKNEIEIPAANVLKEWAPKTGEKNGNVNYNSGL